MTSFLGALSGTLLGFASVYGFVAFRVWQRQRRVDERMRHLLRAFLNKANETEPPKEANPHAN